MDLIQITDRNRIEIRRRYIFEILLCIALSVGCWYTIFSMFLISNIVLHLSVVLFPIIFYIIASNKTFGRYMVFYALMLVAIYFLLQYEQVFSGFLVIANNIIDQINQIYGIVFIPFTTTANEYEGVLALIPVIFMFSAIIASAVYNKEPVLAFIVTALPVVFGLCFKVDTIIWFMLVLILCWTALFVLSSVAKPISRKKDKPIYIQNTKNSALPAIFMAAVLVFSLILSFFVQDAYSPIKSVDSAKEAIVDFTDHIRYEKNGAHIDSLSKGDLQNAKSLMYTDNIVFTVEMDQPSAIYLRGFVGGNYENGKWTETDSHAYSGDYSGITEWLAVKGFYPWCQQSILYGMWDDSKSGKITVNNINANSKYIYLPYEAIADGDVSSDSIIYQKDIGAYSKGLFGTREYSFLSYVPYSDDYANADIEAWLKEIRSNSNYSEYLENEKAYRAFVYDTYLNVPTEAEKIINQTDIGNYKSYFSAIQYIRKYFSENFQYSYEIDELTYETDALAYFMNNSKTGNDMHFATAAALMLRSVGIPARYVEGYYLSPQFMMLYTELEDLSFEIPDSLCHAWIEVYINEIGWVPVEVVPGFYEIVEDNTDETKKDDEIINNPNDIIYPDDVDIDDIPDESNQDSGKISRVWFILAAIILLIAAYELIGRKYAKRRFVKFKTEDVNKAAVNMYRYVLKIMSIDKTDLNGYPYETTNAISEKYDGAIGLKYIKFLNTIYKARFSEHGISREERNELFEFVEKLSEYIYKKQNGLRRFIIKHILFIY